VNVPAILDMMEGRTISGMVMGELDNDGRKSIAKVSEELVKRAGTTWRRLAIRFRQT